MADPKDWDSNSQPLDVSDSDGGELTSQPITSLVLETKTQARSPFMTSTFLYGKRRRSTDLMRLWADTPDVGVLFATPPTKLLQELQSSVQERNWSPAWLVS